MIARAVLRVVASGLAFGATNVFGNILLSLLPGLGMSPIVRPLIVLILAGAAALWVWELTEPRSASDPRVAESTIRWAAIVGGIGFAGGFFGPIVFTPDANQGPLLGIFITGPIGFVLGAIIGYVRGVRARPVGGTDLGSRAEGSSGRFRTP